MVALIICLVLVGASVYANMATQHRLSFPEVTSRGDSSIPRENFGTTQETADQRIKDIRQWIQAELTKRKV